MKRIFLALAAAILAFSAASPAQAGEVFGGVFIHDVKTPLTKSGNERGFDVQAGWRSSPIGRWKLQTYIFAGLSSGGKTHYAAAGISRKFGDKVYFRPALGIAVHTGSAHRSDIYFNHQVEFGSRVLFEPEIAVGTRLNDRTSIEATWMHMSHAQIMSRQNPGMDNFGVRLNYRLR